MSTLFPDMDAEIRDGRRAERRERRQHARQYLRDRDLRWLIEYLFEHGPQTEAQILQAPDRDEQSIDEHCKSTMEILLDLDALHVTGKLWRISKGIHQGAGVESFLYGIRKVHPRPSK